MLPIMRNHATTHCSGKDSTVSDISETVPRLHTTHKEREREKQRETERNREKEKEQWAR